MHTNDKLLHHLSELCSARPITVIGLDGLGGAGKSTLVEQLRAQLQSSGNTVLVLHIDDFIHPRSVRYNDGYPEWVCYYDLQWRFVYFADIIRQIKSGAAPHIDVELYDKDRDAYTTHRYALDGSIIVLAEGIFLQRREYAGLFDCMIYLDAPEDVRLRRVLKRDSYIGGEGDITAKYVNRYFPAERRYVQEYQPQQHADFVLSAAE